jgi:KaiC/GvpD/RAD55 family RecA-like ATPase
MTHGVQAPRNTGSNSVARTTRPRTHTIGAVIGRQKFKPFRLLRYWISDLLTTLFLPIFERILPDGVEFGTNLLVEFEPDSAWYEASLTIVAQALRNGHKALYHTFQHPPADVEHDLKKLGLDLAKLQGDGFFEILDSLAVQTGGLNPVSQEEPIAKSLKIPDLSISAAQIIRKGRDEGVPEEEKWWVHVDDNTAIITRYNPENNVLDFWRTRHFPFSRLTKEITIYSMLKGTVSETFLSQVETISDGIIDFKREDKEGEVVQLFRVRRMRGRKFNSRWQQLNVSETGEVTIVQ